MENSPPHTKRAPPQTFELAKLGRKITLNFGEDLFCFFFFVFFGDHLILGGKNVWISDFGRKITLNFGEDLFFLFFFIFFWRSPNFGRKKRLNFGFRPKNHSEFWRRPFFFFFFFFFLEITYFWAEKTFEFPMFPRHFVSNFGQTVWNWFKVNENSSQRRMHTSHSFKIAPPFFKSWLRACVGLYVYSRCCLLLCSVVAVVFFSACCCWLVKTTHEKFVSKVTDNTCLQLLLEIEKEHCSSTTYFRLWVVYWWERAKLEIRWWWSLWLDFYWGSLQVSKSTCNCLRNWTEGNCYRFCYD